MQPAEEQMARSSYGFGRWDAPYWFLGPEQGKGASEGEDNDLRRDAWEKLGSTELCDCRAFHDCIGETRWHFRALLQRTWKQLITLLLAFEQKPTDSESVREYQRNHWGRIDGEVCAIELSGIAARNMSTSVNRILFRQERIELIRRRLIEHQPVFLVMYGASPRADWEQIAGCALVAGEPVQVGATLVVWTKHPVAHGLGNYYWIGMGDRLSRRVHGARVELELGFPRRLKPGCLR